MDGRLLFNGKLHFKIVVFLNNLILINKFAFVLFEYFKRLLNFS